MAEGYDYFCDGITGKWFAVDRGTGEISNANYVLQPEGTSSVTPQQRKENDKKNAERQEKYLSQYATHDKLGKFYWCKIYGNFTTTNFRELKSETVARLIYLCTFLKHDSDVFMKNKRTPMMKKDLQSILMVSRPTVLDFWKAVYPKYISVNEQGYLISNSNIFFRGSIPKEEIGDSFYKMRINGIRKLYETVEGKHQKAIGFVFWLLPFINIRWNILCFNPLEDNLDKIQPMSISDFCRCVGYPKSHIDDLLKLYKKIKFEVDGHLEYLCVVPYRGNTRDEIHICINPNIIYTGNDYERVAVLSALCKCLKSEKLYT